MQASSAYALNNEETFQLIHTIGHFVTVVVEGGIGTGKTTLREMFMERESKTPSGLDYVAHIYFDCNTKDVGDIAIPMINSITAEGHGVNVIRSAVHEELGLHFDGPVIICVDEIGKALPPVKNQLTRLFNERALGTYKLHPESIVFGTTNLSEENVGDSFLAHQLDRMNRVEMLNPTAPEWLLWALNHNVNEYVCAFVKENPHVLQSFRDVKKPSDNLCIYHPQAPERTAFTTPRSLARGAKIVDMRDRMSDKMLHAALMGEWGPEAASIFMANLSLRDKMPTMDEITKAPEKCRLPDNAAASCAVIFSALRRMNHSIISPWMKYLNRMDSSMQAMFMGSAADINYKHHEVVFSNQLVKDWTLANRHVFASDQK